MTTVRLELLRPGPSDGQLLSPLTQYIAVCNESPPELLQLPFDHRTVLDRLERLRYIDDRPASEADLRDIATLVRSMLARLEGFARAVDTAGRGGKLVHVRLVLNAAELALLPLEFAHAPIALGGLPGFSFSDKVNVVVTRETRQANSRRTSFKRSSKPKILFVVAAPGDAVVPEAAHLRALTKAFESIAVAPTPPERHSAIRVLRDATREDIAAACAERHYDWVHILAHGDTEEQREGRYGLRLHSRYSTQGEVVYGAELASVLTSERRGGTGPTFGVPQVVTLAVCDAGNGGSVVYADSSVAHQLHEAGVALVVASQLPLSFPGSVALTETFYTGLVKGEDPRLLLTRVRKVLFESFPRLHDWASMVAYASLPVSDESLKVTNAVVAWRQRIDVLAWEVEGERFERGHPIARGEHPADRRFESLLEEGRTMLKGDLSVQRRREVNGILGNGYKRLACLVRSTARQASEEEARLLLQAFNHYSLVAEDGIQAPWNAVQVVALWTACVSRGALTDLAPLKRQMSHLWRVASNLTSWRMDRAIGWDRFWLASQKLQLELLATTGRLGVRKTRWQRAYKDFREVLAGLMPGITEEARFDAHVEARELFRITDWWFPNEVGQLAVKDGLFRADIQTFFEKLRIPLDRYLPSPR